MENPIKMDDLGVKPTIFGNIHMDPWDDGIFADPWMVDFLMIKCRQHIPVRWIGYGYEDRAYEKHIGFPE